MMIGIINPLILLPQTNYSSGELSFILRHELVHWKRKDLWYKALVLLATTIHWFNPIVYLMAKTIAIQCEVSCDAEVVRNTDMNGRRQYSETILNSIQYRSKMQTALSTSFYGGKNGMKARICSIMDTTKKKAGLLILCLVLIATVGTGVRFAANSQSNTTGKSGETAEPFRFVAAELLNTCDFPVVLPEYFPSPNEGEEWSLSPEIKNGTFTIEIDQKMPGAELGIYVGSISGNVGEPSAQPLEKQFESGGIAVNDISLPGGISGKEYIDNPNLVGGTAITWETRQWNFFVNAYPDNFSSSTANCTNQIINDIQDSGQALPGSQGKFYYFYIGNKPLTRIYWEVGNDVWYVLDWPDINSAIRILQSMKILDVSELNTNVETTVEPVANNVDITSFTSNADDGSSVAGNDSTIQRVLVGPSKKDENVHTIYHPVCGKYHLERTDPETGIRQVSIDDGASWLFCRNSPETRVSEISADGVSWYDFEAAFLATEFGDCRYYLQRVDPDTCQTLQVSYDDGETWLFWRHNDETHENEVSSDEVSWQPAPTDW